MKRSEYGVHERHCCPKHGCKYGDKDCPVVTGKTSKHNTHCEWCERDYNDPDPIDLLVAWATAHSTYLHIGVDKWGHSVDGDVVEIYELEKTRDDIRRDKYAVVKKGIEDGWWKRDV